MKNEIRDNKNKESKSIIKKKSNNSLGLKLYRIK